MSFSNDRLRALQGIERSTTGSAGFTARVRFTSSMFLILLILLILSSCTAVGGAPLPLQVKTAGLQQGQVAAAYQATIHAAGGTQPYAWSLVSGSLPAGLRLDPSGVIRGTPSQSGSSTFMVKVTDSSNQSTGQYLVITISRGWGSSPALQVSTPAVPPAKVGAPYQGWLSATGGTPPYTWGVQSGSLPAGLALDPSSGAISGMPNQPGNSSFTVQVNDSASQAAQQLMAMSVGPAVTPLQITTSSLAGGQVGTSYQASMSVTGGTQPYSWSIVSGALPSSLALNAASGAISGTPSTAGNSSFTVKVSDSGSQSAQQPLAISVAAAVAPLQITTSSLAGGQVGTSYQASVSVTGGTQPYSWSIASGALPASLALNAASGAISGMPSTAGNSSFTVKVNDAAGKPAQQPLAISVAAAPAAPLQITTSSLAGGQVGTSYQASVSVTGGTQPYSWSIASGALPSSLALNAASGTISGMPSTAGNSSFTVKVNDAAGKPAQQPLAISVAASPAAPLQITTSSLAGGQVGTSYQASVSVTGGTQPYSWSIVSGLLPTGLALNAASGTISGTPGQVGNSPFVVKVADSRSQSAQQILTIGVTASLPPLQITTSGVASGQVGVSYQATVSATGGTQPYSWSLSSGLLPSGLTLTSAGAITGIPTSAGQNSFALQVKDASASPQIAEQALGIQVSPAPPSALSIQTSSLPQAMVGQPYSFTLQASGGQPGYTWSISSGALPSGLMLDAASGHISGTTSANGALNLTVHVADSSSPPQTASAALTLTVAALAATDQYGGLLSMSSPNGGTGSFRLEKFGNRWMLVTPEGHGYWYLGVALVSTGNPGADQSGKSYSDYANAKYNGDQNMWASQTKKRLLSWGFNGIGQDSSSLVLSYGTYNRQPTSPLMPHFNDRPGFAMNSMRNVGGYISSPIKNFLVGWGAFPDVFDPGFRAYAFAEMGQNTNSTTGGLQAEVNSPWVIGYIPDESDELTGFTSSISIHPGWGAVAAVPTQTTGSLFGIPYTYSDHTVYTKLAVRDFLKGRYNGDINALNQAWNSAYTTWDSAGSYGAGTGLLDENGKHPWMGDGNTLSGETPTMQTDLNDFLFQIAKQYFQIVHDAIRSVDQNHLVFSPNNLGSDARPQILLAAKDYVDAFMAATQLASADQTINSTPIANIYNLTGKPAISASHFMEAIPDSSLATFYPNYPIGQPESMATSFWNTQAQRGAAYASYVQALLQLQASDGTNPVLGYHWWALVDDWNQKANFGLVTIRDNAYDGKETNISSCVDAWGYPCGGEVANYGDSISAIKSANQGILNVLGASH
jgi:hypothetical protein